MMFTGSQVHVEEAKLHEPFSDDDVHEGLPNEQTIPAVSGDPEVDEAHMSALGPSSNQDEVEGLVEIFDDGRRSIVGTGDDPDDVADATAVQYTHMLSLRM